MRQKLKETKGLSRFKPFLVKVDIARDLVDVFAAHRSELFTWRKVAERLVRSLGIGDSSALAEYLPPPG